MDEKISIIMSVYNETEKELELSIDSILQQTYKNIEFIIILDNPLNMNLYNKIKQYSEKDKRIKFYSNLKNMGLAKSLNKGIELSTGKYIARMDADDISIETRLEKQIKFLKKNEDVYLIGGQAEQIDENNKKIRELKYECNYMLIKKIIKYRSCFLHPTIMFKRELLENIKGYRNFPCAQDYDLFYRIIDSGYKCENLPDKILKYRIRKNSISNEKKLFQLLLTDYIQELAIERNLNGKDNFSELKVKELENKFKENSFKFKKVNDLLRKIKEDKKIIYIPYIYIASKIYRKEINKRIKIFAIKLINKIKV